MYTALFMLAALFGASYQSTVDVAQIATELSQERDPALYFPELAKEDLDAARFKMASLWVVFAFHESSFQPSALGDHGRSCGLMQVQPKAGYPSCQQMLKNPKVAMRAGAMAMEDAIKECGTLKKGLSAYASGTCGGAKKLVEQRCKEAGGC